MKRRHSEREYTQGPVDELFGQQPVLPLPRADDPESAAVLEYLRSVRQDALNDRVFHSTRRERRRETETGSEVLSCVDAEEARRLVARLLEAKEAYGDFRDSVDLSIEGETERDPRETERDQSGESERGETERDESGESETDTERDGPPVPDTAAQWRDWVFLSPPPPQEWFFSLQHHTVVRLVILYTKWLLVSMPETLRAWIFCTFVRLDSAMDHADASQLRGLGKKAQKVWRALAVGSAARDTAAMVLALLSEYYGQRDLVRLA